MRCHIFQDYVYAMPCIFVKRLQHCVEIPSYATDGSAGIDLIAATTADIIISPNTTAVIPTGVCVQLPPGFEAQIRPRSGIALRYSVTVINSPGTIDSDYRGEVKVMLINHGRIDFCVTRGMKIAQMVVTRYEHVDIIEANNLGLTTRGDGGFGSTGV
jgi:dUTP pyrophosphatase